MRIAFARGNDDYVVEGRNLDNRVLYGGIVLTRNETCRRLTLKEKNNQVPWGDKFHKYGLIWESGAYLLLFT